MNRLREYPRVKNGKSLMDAVQIYFNREALWKSWIGLR